VTDNYPNDCKSRDTKNPIMCKIFDMSCAFFHTCIFGHKDGKCCYYEVIP
jgi:hypothetical protein